MSWRTPASTSAGSAGLGGQRRARRTSRHAAVAELERLREQLRQKGGVLAGEIRG